MLNNVSLAVKVVAEVLFPENSSFTFPGAYFPVLNGNCWIFKLISLIIIYMKKFLHADWLRACQLILNSAKTLIFFECRKMKLVQKVEIECKT